METEFFIFCLVGFLAQLVDGALGMAYGVVSSTVLLAFGVPPAQASASVHAAELFTTAASGASHAWQRNVDFKLMAKLAPTGILGGVVGAFVLTSIDGDTIRPFVLVYLGLLGVFLILRTFRPFPTKPVGARVVMPLGGVGGFLDAVGGGGWGPIVTSSLIGAGGQPRYVIGSVNATEFLVTLAISVSFVAAFLSGHWEEAGALTDHLAAVGGLIAGGIVAAPLAGLAVAALPTRALTGLVGTLVLLTTAFQTVQILT
ncbi:MAG: sulfite exporter TauE/SafE family protein [Rhizobiales bacterium]|jgi:uncharacterized membrane protein YfcA|nr:sulfite exporter TauE/SafE family protein [Hyphomicrobiales bacterium]